MVYNKVTGTWTVLLTRVWKEAMFIKQQMQIKCLIYSIKSSHHLFEAGIGNSISKIMGQLTVEGRISEVKAVPKVTEEVKGPTPN